MAPPSDQRSPAEKFFTGLFDVVSGVKEGNDANAKRLCASCEKNPPRDAESKLCEDCFNGIVRGGIDLAARAFFPKSK